MNPGNSPIEQARHGGRAEESEAATFRMVLDAEWEEIRRRRGVWLGAVEGGEAGSAGSEAGGAGEAIGAPDGAGGGGAGSPWSSAGAGGGSAGNRARPVMPPPRNLVGLALSGGGIRSATFALGLLQRMSRLGTLRLFDYVSTVSGGGYTGGWWSAWLSRPDRRPRQLFPPPELGEPDRWPENAARTARQDESVPEASMSVQQNDPIHHLRLFANYLTPRKGLLSADTWRGATVVTRNLLLTWLVLLPLLLAAVVAGQVYFTLSVHPEENFLRDFPVAEVAVPATGVREGPPAEAVADGAALATQREIAIEAAEAVTREARLAAIRERAGAAARPIVVLFLWIVMLTLIWVVHGSGSSRFLFMATLVGTAAALTIGYLLYRAVNETRGSWPLSPGWTYLLFAGAVILVVGCRALPTYLFTQRSSTARLTMPADLLRNRVVRAHGAVLVTAVVLTGALIIAGFSHDIVWFLFHPASGGPLPSWVKQTGGWAAVVGTVGAMLFTGFMGAPAGGAGDGESRPSAASRFLFAITPVLALTLLAMLAATVGRSLIQELGNIEYDLHRTDGALLIAIALFMGFAIFETLESDLSTSRWRKAAPAIAALAVGAIFLTVGPDPAALTLGQVVMWTAIAIVLLPLRWAGIFRADARGRKPGSGTGPAPDASPEERRHRFTVAAVSLAAVLGAIGWLLSDAELRGTRHFQLRGEAWVEMGVGGGPGGFPLLLLAAALACGVFAAAEQLFAPSDRRRAVALLTVAVAALTTRAVIPFLPLEATSVAYSLAATTLVVLSLAWVVGLGWMANPNMLSLHAFYKARLVRAYLGASNPERQSQEITESAVGDDVPLRSLANCDLGAPYQLVNTTLNMVAGRDLTTAQRSADSFLLSKRFCGSTRTGYRPTNEYMGGELTLGTAVAISGAAASPNMGSQTPTAALSMLLALLNVRLAFWAPTPNRPLWQASRPRLWPFYLLREFLSQTHELSPYCCLSDGGHFDNSGIYPLVARGCRYIVLSDCGADPLPCFEDVGNAIRRCRIDFKAEIELRIDDFLRKAGEPARAHHTVGTITYAESHARALGWPDWADPAARRGVIIWIKPALTMTRESADLRQYSLENPIFPQHSTADQWYDEAQFESYRRLGEYTAQETFGDLQLPEIPQAERVQAFFEGLVRNEVTARTHIRTDRMSVAGQTEGAGMS